MAKLKPEVVAYIRENPQITLKALGKELNLHWSTVWGVRSYRTHNKTKQPRVYKGICKLTEQDVRAIRADTESTLKVLAERFGVKSQTVWDIRNGQSWSHVT